MNPTHRLLKRCVSLLALGSLSYVASGQSNLAGNAIVLNGANAYISIRDTSVLKPTTTLTIEAWVKRDSGGSGNPVIIDKGSYRLRFDGTNLSQKLKFYLNAGAGLDSLTSKQVLGVGVWVHVAAVYTGSLMQLYIDGSLDTTRAKTGSILASADSLMFGRQDTATADYFKGTLDEVRLWNVARIVGQINGSMTHSLTGVQSGLVGYWQMNEPSGSFIYDSSGYKSNGILRGGVTFTKSTVFPVRPKNLSINVTSFAAQLTWSQSVSSNILRYRIYRKVNAGVLGIRDSVNALSSVYVDTVHSGNAYRYYISAVDSNITVSDSSNNVSINLPAPIPPSNLVALPKNGSVLLNWVSSPSSGASQYKLYRKTITTPRQFDTLVAFGVNGLARTGLTNDTTYVFDITTIDSSGTESGYSTASIVTPHSIMAGNTLVLDGASAYAAVANGSSLQPTSQVTVEAWVKREIGGTGNPIILDKNVYGLRFDGTGVTQKVEFFLVTAGSDTLPSSQSIPAGVWTHIAGVYDGSSMRLYVNGVQDTSMSKVGSITTTTDSLFFGRPFGGLTDFLKGRIDEVRIWSVKKDSNEIKANIGRVLYGNEAGLAGYWRMDEQVGTKTYDASVNGDNGTLSGGANYGRSSVYPVRPKNVTTVQSGKSVNVTWTSSLSSNILRYRLLRKDYLTGVFSLLDSTGPSSTSYSDSNFVNGYTYSYAAFSVDSNLSVSDTSNVSSVTTLPNLVNLVSSNINTSVTWTKTNGAYKIIGSIQLLANDTLTIQHGTVVQFDAGSSLTVFGVLRALGVSGDSVRFTTSNASPAKGQWSSLRFDNSGSMSEMRYSVVEFGGDTVISSDISGMRLRISNSLIWRNNGGIKHTGGVVDSISNTIITQNNTFGIYANGTVVLSGDSVISNGGYGINTGGSVNQCTVRNNGGNGITSGGSVTSCMVLNNGGYGINSTGSVNSSVVTANAGYGIQTGKSVFQTKINNNIGYGVSIGDTAYGCVVYGNSGKGIIAGKLIRSDSVYSNTQEGIILGSTVTVVDSNTIFKNVQGGINVNNNTSGVKIRRNVVYRQSVGIFNISTNTSVENNTLVKNDTGVVTGTNSISDTVRDNIIAFGAKVGLKDNDVTNNPYAAYNDIISSTGGFVSFVGFPSQYGTALGNTIYYDPADVYGNVSVDPLFADTSSDSYFLKSSASHMINTGDPSPSVPKDPDGSIADLGAYYYFLPLPPTNVVGVMGSGSVTLSWTGAALRSPVQKQYRIYRRTPTTGRQLDGTVPYGTNSYTKTGLTNDTTYVFEVTTVDSSGAEGGYSNAMEITPHGNVAGNMVVLDGLSGYVAAKDTVSLRPASAVTVEAWVKRDSGGTGNPTIIDKNTYKLQFVGTGSSQIVQFVVNAGGSTTTLQSKQTIPVGVWTHIAGVYDGSKSWLYINGIYDTSTTKTGTISTTTDSLMMGKNFGGSTDYLKGRLDEVRVWNIARSSGQIAGSMASVLTGNETGLVGYWRMDEQVGTKAYDATANGNDGTLKGGSSNGRSNVYPIRPKNLAVSTLGFVNTMTWTPGGSANVMRYRINRNVNNTSFVVRDSVGNSLSSYQDTVQSGSTYSYYVTAVDSLWTGSDSSNNASTTLPQSVPPTNVVGVMGSGSVTLGWTGTASIKAKQYRIYRRTPTTGRQLDGTVPYGTNSYTKTGLTNDTTYVFEVTTVDSSGAEGGYSNAMEITPHGNVAGNMVVLDGLSGYVAAKDTVSLRPASAVTVEAWVKRDSGGTGNPTIVDKNRYKMKFSGTGTSSTVQFGINGSMQLTSKQSIPVGVWTHIAGVYDGAKMWLYVNGVLDTSIAQAGAITYSTADSLVLGRIYSGSTDYLKGRLDEVRVWNIARSSGQIAGSMASVLTGNETGLVGYWRMDEQVGTKAYDATANGNDGTLKGGSSNGRSNVYPIRPKNLAVSTLGFVNTMTWTPGGSANVMRYRINRNVNNTSFVVRDSVGNSLSSYQDTVQSGSTYSYYVTAVDSLWTGSDSSNNASTTLPQSVPPTNVVGVMGSGSVTLGWTGTASIKAKQYRIYRRTPTTGRQLDGTVPYGTNSYTKTGLTNDTTYVFEVTTVDSSGAEGGYSNAMEITPHGNVAGNMVVLDGLSGYVAAKDTVSLRPASAVTVEAWVKRDSGGTGNPTIIDKNTYKLQFVGTGSSQIVQFVVNAGGSTTTLQSKQTIPVGVWTHIAGVYDGSKSWLYINGIYDTSTTKTGTISTTTDSLMMGKNFGGSTDYLKGRLDEVRVWNIARSSGQIAGSMASVLTGNETGLVGYWRMDEQVGTKAYDATANGNDGTLKGGSSNGRSNVYPIRPKNLAVSTLGFVNTMTWTPGGSANVMRYRINRNVNNTSFVVRDSVGNSLSSYQDTVQSGSTYSYYVTAVDSLWTGSDSSNNASTTLPQSVPPTNVVGVMGSGSVTLGWTGTASIKAKQYRIYRRTPTTGRQLDGTVPYGTNSYTKTGLTNDTTYVFEVTTVDSSGAEGGYSNAMEITPHGNVAGNMVVLDGLSGYVAAKDTVSLRPASAVTLEAWVKRDSGGTGSPTIVDKNRYKMKFSGTGTASTVQFGINGSMQLTSKQSIPVGVWTHIAGVYDGAKMWLYVNGVLDTSIAQVGAITYSTADSLVLGRIYSGSTDYLKGRLDEVRVWNIARSSGQIAGSMASVLTGNETGLVGYWRMDEQVGTKAYDATANGNDGTLKGGSSNGRSNVYPICPKNVTASQTGYGSPINISWTPSLSSNILRYRLIRKDYLTSVFSVLDSVGSGSTSYADNVFVPGYTYSYAVLAVESSMTASDASNIASITIPPPPGHFVGSDISVNTTWTKGSGAYEISGNIKLLRNDTLTIQRGTVVQFDAGSSLTVLGVLRALGVLGDSVRFTTSNSSPAKGQWNSLRFDTSGAMSELRYSIVEFGGDTVISSDINGMRLRISNSLIWKNNGGIKHTGGAIDSIVNTIVTQNSTFGIYASGMVVLSGDSVISNGGYGINTAGSVYSCSARANGGYGMSVKSAFQANAIGNQGIGLMITDTAYGCKVGNNLTKGISGGKLLRKNTVFLNQQEGIVLGSSTAAVVDSNTIFKNAGGGINVSNNTFGVKIRRNVVYRQRIGAFNIFTNAAIENNTLALNDTGMVTGTNSLTDTIRNNIVAFGTKIGLKDNDVTKDPYTVYNDIFSNASGFIPYVGFSSSVSNLNVDPLFVDTASDNYFLKANSYLINGGDPNTPLDPDGTIADVGAFYYDTTIASPIQLSPANGTVGLARPVVVIWKAAQRALNYHVQVGADSTFAASLVMDTTVVDTNVVLNRLSGFTRYFWRVGVNYSNAPLYYSGSRNFRPRLASSSSFTSISITSRSLGLNWTKIDSSSKYFVLRGTDSTSAPHRDSSVTNTFVDSALAPATLYYYRLVSASANRELGDTSMFYVALTPPAMSTNVTASASTDSVVTLTWNSPTGIVNRYFILRSTDSLTFAPRDSSLTSSYADSGLVPSVKYWYRIVASNGIRQLGDTSAKVSVQMPRQLSRISSLSLSISSLTGDVKVVLSMFIPAGDTVRLQDSCSIDNGKTHFWIDSTITGKISNITSSGNDTLTWHSRSILPTLENNVIRFKTQPIGRGGLGGIAKESTPFSLDNISPQFAGIDTALGDTNRVIVRWRRGQDLSGPIKYIVYHDSIAGRRNFVNPDTTTNDSSYVVRGLQNFRTYYFYVFAKDTLGNIDTTKAGKSGIPTARSRIASMVQPVVTQTRDVTIKFTVSVPQQDTVVYAYRYSTDGVSFLPAKTNDSLSVKKRTQGAQSDSVIWKSGIDFGNSEGSTIQFRITPIGKGGRGDSLVTATFAVDNKPPQFAGIDTALGDTNRVTVRWRKASDLSVPISYLVYRDTVQRSWTMGTAVGSTTDTNIVVSGLQNFKTYYFYVFAGDTLGNIDTMKFSKFAIPAARPQVTSIVSFLGTQTKDIKVKFNVNVPQQDTVDFSYMYSLNGGAKFDTVKGFSWKPQRRIQTGQDSVIWKSAIDDTSEGANRQFRILPIGRAGTGIAFTTPTFAVDNKPPQFAGIDTALGDTNRVLVRWPRGQDLSGPIKYIVYHDSIGGRRKFVNPDTTTIDSSYVVRGLQNFKTYYFYVFAKDTLGYVDTTKASKIGTPAPRSQVTSISLTSGTQTKDIKVKFNVNVPQQDTVTYAYRYSTDGISFLPAKTDDSLSVKKRTQGAQSDSVIWKSGIDYTNNEVSTVQFQIIPIGRGGNGNAFTTATFAVDNKPPQFAGIDTALGDTNRVLVRWPRGQDLSGPIKYIVYHDSIGGRRKFVNPDTTTIDSSYVVRGLQNFKTYYFYVFAKDTLGNIDTTKVGKSGIPTARSRIASMVQPGGTQTRDVKIRFSVNVPQQDTVDFAYMYSLNGGARFDTVKGFSWKPQRRIQTGQDSVIWKSAIDDTSEGTNRQFRIIPIGRGGNGNALTTATFAVDNKPPQFAGIGRVVWDTVQPKIVWNTATDMSPIYYSVYTKTIVGGQDSLIATTQADSLYVSSSMINRIQSFAVHAIDSLGNVDTNTRMDSISIPVLCDFDGQDGVNAADLQVLIQAKKQNNLRVGDVGPVSPSDQVPFLHSIPDGRIDLNDLVVFARMWNWSVPLHHVSGSIKREVVSKGLKEAIVELREQPVLKQRETKPFSIGITGVSKVQTLSFSIEFDTAQVRIDSLIVPRSVSTFSLTKVDNLLGYAILDVTALDGTLDSLILKKTMLKFIMTAKKKLTEEPVLIAVRTYSNVGDSNSYTTKELHFNFRPVVPESFALYQNYPNPFNPTTTIQYDLASDARVTLKVYDLLGREIETLVDQVETAGYYQVRWKGASRNLPVASGVYFYRLRAGNFVQTKKMIMLR